MDTAQWQQETGFVKTMEENMGSNPCTKPGLEKKVRPQEQLNCPRCNSTNTKFCYYNNYSLTQPRYFCKTCRRYWTEGGTLRNVPVGGGSRKNKKPSSSASSSSPKIPDLNPPSFSHFSSENPNTHHGQDLNLAFPAMAAAKFHGTTQFVELPKSENDPLFRNGITSRGLSSFMANPVMDSNTMYSTSSGFNLQEFKPTIGFCVDGAGDRYNRVQESGGGRILFPFGELKHISSAGEVDQNKGQGNPTGYWSGLLGGGGSW
ncbi:hypothetical protein UlMin_021748 [Ulmus minor]